jgi:acyl-CoA thioesterase I
MFGAACDNPIAPPPPGGGGGVTPDPPSIACPQSIAADVATAPAVVTFPAPTVSAGATPLVTSCTIESGQTFPVGSTDVICTTTDSLSRRSQCTFQVRVTISARLQGTKFLAFGDSITEGEVAPPVAGARVRVVDTVNNYPTVLQSSLRDQFPSQTADIRVINAGKSGLTAVQDEDRLVDEVSRNSPDVLLLLHGTNDVNGGAFPGAIGNSLRSDIRRAKQRGVKLVLLSTLLPQVPGRFRAFNPDGIIETNFVIRDIAPREGAILVDSFAVLNPMKEKLIGNDGLHPTVEGYRVLADTFLAAIRANFQAAPPASFAPQSTFFAHPGRR